MLLRCAIGVTENNVRFMVDRNRGYSVEGLVEGKMPFPETVSEQDRSWFRRQEYKEIRGGKTKKQYGLCRIVLSSEYIRNRFRFW